MYSENAITKSSDILRSLLYFIIYSKFGILKRLNTPTLPSSNSTQTYPPVAKLSYVFIPPSTKMLVPVM